MKVEFDRNACSAWFQCVQEWDAFTMNMPAGKADLEDAEEVDDETFVRDVPADAEEAAIEAAKSCPVEAIVVVDDDGNDISLDDD